VPARRRKNESDVPRGKPATTPEGREQQVIAQAIDLAERQIQEGTASSQVITHFLKAGSPREELERLRLEYENELTKVKIEQVKSAQRTEELYQEALTAMRSYSGIPTGAELDESD
jgi:hypothetical protein